MTLSQGSDFLQKISGTSVSGKLLLRSWLTTSHSVFGTSLQTSWSTPFTTSLKQTFSETMVQLALWSSRLYFRNLVSQTEIKIFKFGCLAFQTTKAQSFKGSMSVNWTSRVVLTSRLLKFTTLEL